MIITGFDTGGQGCVASLDEKGDLLNIKDLPLIKKETRKRVVINRAKPFYQSFNLINPNFIKDYILENNPDYVYVEGITGSEGRNSKTSLLTQGYNYNAVYAGLMMAGFNLDNLVIVHSGVWKKALGVHGKKDGCEKKKMFEYALRIYPEDAKLFYGPKGGKLDGRSDALGVACYGLKDLVNKGILSIGD